MKGKRVKKGKDEYVVMEVIDTHEVLSQLWHILCFGVVFALMIGWWSSSPSLLWPREFSSFILLLAVFVLAWLLGIMARDVGKPIRKNKQFKITGGCVVIELI